MAAGSQYVYTLSGVSATDILGGSPSGTVTVGATGQVIIPITLREDAATEGAETITLSVAGQTASVTVNDTSMAPPPAGQTIVLNTEPEAKVGGAGDDVFRGTDKTLTLDKLDGAGHINGDTLIYNDTTGGVNLNSLGLEMVNVEIVEARSVGATTATTTALTGVTTLNATFGTSAVLTAAATTDINVGQGITGAVTVNGGKNVVVNDVTADNAISVGATTGPAGNVTVTDTKQGTGDITVARGADVTVTSTVTTSGTTDINNAGNITIGGGGAAATGAVSVTQNLVSDGEAAIDNGDIIVTGGTTVNVTINATSSAKTSASNDDIQMGDVTVTAGDATTAVTINQVKTATTTSSAAVGAVTETNSIKFGNVRSGDTVTISVDNDAVADAGELSFTASKDLTAAEVAAAFANLIASDTQTATGPVSNGVFTGALSGWTSAAASGDTVVFTSTTAASDRDNIQVVVTNGAGTGTRGTPVVTATNGSAATTAAATSSNVITYGAVVVNENTKASVTSVTVNGYSSADLGDTGTDLNALTTLSLANSGGAATVDTSAATLALTVNKVDHTVDFSGAASLKTLNVTATGANSTFGLNAASVETLTVAGDKVLDIDTGSTLSDLKAVTVTGSAGLSLAAAQAATLTSVDTTGTTGTVTSTIDASKATYSGGAGVDNVTLSSTTVSKAVSTGGGNDTVTLASGTTSLTANVAGGEGDDTLVMAAADAVTASGNVVFETKIDGFEKLSLGAATAIGTVNLANLDDISYVIAANSTAVTTAPTKATFTLDLTGTTLLDTGDTLAFNGGTLTATSDITTPNALALALGGLTYTNWDVKSVSGATITFEAKVAGTGTAVPTAPVFILTDDGAPLSDVDQPITSSTAGVAAGSPTAPLTLDKMANNGTLELVGPGDGAGVTVVMTDASGTADTFNIVTKVDAANLNFGTVSVAGVENINITATDTATGTVNKATLALTNSAAKTVNVNGSSDLDLNLTNAAAVTAVNAASLTGKLILTATGTAALTVTGGSGADQLTGSGSGDVLKGGAGNDTLTGANLTELWGEGGNDTFVINMPTNVNNYSTIMDLASGDTIDLGAATTIVFNKTAVVPLAPTAVFQDYANASVNSLGTDADDAAWFQFEGNTYIVKSGNATAGNDFVNGQDSIIKIVGLVDLSTASYNQSDATLQIA